MKTIHIIIIFFLFAFTLSVGIYFGSYAQPNDNVVSELEKEIAGLKAKIRDKEAEIADLKEQLKNVEIGKPTSEPDVETASTSDSGDAVTMVDAEIDNLLSGDPKFADVLALYTRLSADETVWKQLTEKNKLSAYYNVCNTLLTGDFKSIKAIMDPSAPIYKGLSDKHKWAVLVIGYGSKEVKWAAASLKGKQGADEGIKWYISNRNKNKYSTFSKVFTAFKSYRNIGTTEL